MISSLNDTICAVSTPRGTGAIAIIRISGSDCFAMIKKIFRGKKKIEAVGHAAITHGDIVHPVSNDILDDVLISKFVRPNSFTGEDIIEINCHGGAYIVQEIMSLVLEQGARLAEPGEFTKRAFINGKMDLLQAESIADVIEAQTKLGLKYARQQLSGVLSQKLVDLRQRLMKQLGLLEIELDFSDEDIEFANRSDLVNNIEELVSEIEKLLRSFKFGKILREGVHLALVGKPNVGKSSVMNRLLEEERAIVSELPGTTRDVIEESLDIDGLLFKMSDTAGIRLTEDFIESKGVQRTRKTLEYADQILFIVDASEPLDQLDIDAMKIVKKSNTENVLLLINKIDKNGNKVDSTFVEQFPLFCEISALTGEGFDLFKKLLVESNIDPDVMDSGVIFNKVRHRDALRRCKEFVEHARVSITSRLSPEFIALDMRAALDALGEVTGEVTTDDVLDDIFSAFCIGK